jgi:hypothetical protein
VVINCYADDSGNQPGPNSPEDVFVLAAYAMPENRWEDFSEKWYAQLKRDHPVSYCRMSDAEYGEGAFVGIPEEFRKRKAKDLALVIQECDPTPLVCIMQWKDYASHYRGKVDPRLENPYAILFFQIMKGIADLQVNLNQVQPVGFHPVDFIFDEQEPAEFKCLQWYAALREKLPEPQRTIIGNTPSFKDDRDIMPLQAADMLAWHVHREFNYPNERRDIPHLITPNGLLVKKITADGLDKIVEIFNSGRIDPSSI